MTFPIPKSRLAVALIIALWRISGGVCSKFIKKIAVPRFSETLRPDFTFFLCYTLLGKKQLLIHSDRKLKALTVIHNFHLKRPDGTTVAERFFESKSINMFEWLVENNDFACKAEKKSETGKLSLMADLMIKPKLSLFPWLFMVRLKR